MDDVLRSKISHLKAVIVLGGDIRPSDNPDHLGHGWQSLQGTETVGAFPVPSIERVWAAAMLFRMNPALTLIASGGRARPYDASGRSRPAISTIMSAELRALGVPQNRIIEEYESNNTLEQILNTWEIARKNVWAWHTIGFLSLNFHLPRIQAMIFQEPRISLDAHSLITFLSAERILKENVGPNLTGNNTDWPTYFQELYKKPEMHKAIDFEIFGTGQLLSGHSPFHPHPYPGFPDPLHTSET
jgi:hypothetical protein